MILLEVSHTDNDIDKSDVNMYYKQYVALKIESIIMPKGRKGERTLLDDLLGRLSGWFGLGEELEESEESHDFSECGLDEELLEEFLHDIDEEIDDAPQPLLGEISLGEIAREVAQDAGTLVDEEESSRRNGCEEGLIIREIEGDLQSEIAEPHEEILDEMGEADDHEIAEEIAVDLEIELEDAPSVGGDEPEDSEIIEDIMQELREDIEGEDYVPTFESDQLEFEDEEK